MRKNEVYELFRRINLAAILKRNSISHNSQDLRVEQEISALYNEIYEQYGGCEYRGIVPEAIRICNARWMIENKISEDEIIKKHGKRVYKKARESKSVAFLKRAVSILLCSAVMWVGGMGIIYATDTFSDEYTIASETINKQAEECNPNWESESIIAYVLTQLTGLGREEPKNEFGLHKFTYLVTEETGVCRNYADYFAELINQINPEYKARVIHTYNFEEGLEDGGTLLEKLDGNHAIVIMQIGKDNLNLIIDPYNSYYEYNDLAIGFLQDGKIYMLKDGFGDTDNIRTYSESTRVFGNYASVLYNVSLQETTRTIEETYALVKAYNDEICRIMHEMARDTQGLELE